MGVAEAEAEPVYCSPKVDRKEHGFWAGGEIGRVEEWNPIKTLMVALDLGLQSLAAAEPIKAHHWAHALLRQNKACTDQRGAEGPDAIQIVPKTSNTSIDPVARKCYRNGLRVLIRGKEAFAN